MKKIVNQALVWWFGFAYAQAAAAADPFRKLDDKGNSISDFITGHLALTFATVIIAIAGIALMMSRLSSQWALKIIGGAVIVGGAGEFASWALK